MNKKILIVDDEADLLALVSRGLQRAGYAVTGASDGREALALAGKIMPDLVILDIYLPYVNGDEITRDLRKDEKLKHVPVLLISSVLEGLAELAAERGADGYLHKPFELEELLAMVKKHCHLPEGGKL